MSNSRDRLYELLPAVYRQRDTEQGYPLRALLRVIAEQVNLVEKDIGQLYENWFIETCEDWVVPYIGALIGYQIVHEAGEPGDPRMIGARELNKILIPRREVANAIRYRRCKGTLALLELLANNVAGWPARAVEFYKLLGWTQNLNHQHLHRGRITNLHKGEMLNQIDGAFEEAAHTVDIRRINSHRTQDRYNIPSVGVFVWRLKSYSVSWTNAVIDDWKSYTGWTRACCVEEEAPHCYTFSVLGNDTPLYNRPQRETDPSHIAGELNLPTPIRRHAFADRHHPQQVSSEYYGPEKSLVIWAPDWPKKGADQPIPRELIIPANLNNWYYHAPRNHIAVDPESGRIVFPSRQLPKQGVLVYYQYAFSADIGGGEYERRLLEPPDSKVYRVGYEYFKTITSALEKWEKEDPKPPSAIIEITDSGVYTEPINITLEENQNLQIRAVNRNRPVIRMLDYMADRPDAFTVSGKKGSRLTLDGLLISGRGIQVTGVELDPDAPANVDDLCAVTIRHCTLVPGWALHCDCEPQRPAEPSIDLSNTRARIKIDHSIIGPIRVIADKNLTSPLCIEIRDSIWDSTSDEREVLCGPDWDFGYVCLTIARSTVIGKILAHEIALAENCIFRGTIRVARRQYGCVRFCYVEPGSRTPRRYECQPDLVEQVIVAMFAQGIISETERDARRDNERLRVQPQFNSARYGTPAYCQLAQSCAEEITRGADDESEMGAFHDLYQPQRTANLRARLEEFTPAGMEAGIIFES